MTWLYRFEIKLADKDIVAIINAVDDQAAFKHLDVELEKFYLRMPEVKEVIMREKKRTGKQSGYILDDDEKWW
ncbi:MAG: DUF3906 family protein [Defluviitaleaceae bacterium]|nr:DUF3906 family protein [Defluviitaleaceae bacterium]